MDKFGVKKTTFILTNNIDEKEIPISISENIKDFLINNSKIDSYKIIDSVAIKKYPWIRERR